MPVGCRCGIWRRRRRKEALKADCSSTSSCGVKQFFETKLKLEVEQSGATMHLADEQIVRLKWNRKCLRLPYLSYVWLIFFGVRFFRPQHTLFLVCVKQIDKHLIHYEKKHFEQRNTTFNSLFPFRVIYLHFSFRVCEFFFVLKTVFLASSSCDENKYCYGMVESEIESMNKPEIKKRRNCRQKIIFFFRSKNGSHNWHYSKNEAENKMNSDHFLLLFLLNPSCICGCGGLTIKFLCENISKVRFFNWTNTLCTN